MNVVRPTAGEPAAAGSAVAPECGGGRRSTRNFGRDAQAVDARWMRRTAPAWVIPVCVGRQRGAIWEYRRRQEGVGDAQIINP